MNKDKAKQNTKEAALIEYRDSESTVADIAKHHKICVSELSAWVREAGIPRRPRGPRRLKSPSMRSRKVLEYAVSYGFSKAANRFGLSRQHISSLARRWGIVARRRLDNNGLILEKRERKARREIVVSFRLRIHELVALRRSLPESITQTATSCHRLVRAAVLAQIDRGRMNDPSPNFDFRLNSNETGVGKVAVKSS